MKGSAIVLHSQILLSQYRGFTQSLNLCIQEFFIDNQTNPTNCKRRFRLKMKTINKRLLLGHASKRSPLFLIRFGFYLSYTPREVTSCLLQKNTSIQPPLPIDPEYQNLPLQLNNKVHLVLFRNRLLLFNSSPWQPPFTFSLSPEPASHQQDL